MIEQKPIQIFSNPDDNIGVNVIKSPVKLTILEMLRDHDMEFEEIVNNTGKSKSTISVHLKSLRENGVISYRLHPIDNRKKIFYLNSKYIGSVDVSEPKEIEETQADYLIKNIVEVDAEFSTLLFHTLKAMLIQEGINIDPILQSTGNSIGRSIFDKLYDDDLNVFMDNIADFWQRKGLGRITFTIGQVIRVTTYDCFECELLQKQANRHVIWILEFLKVCLQSFSISQSASLKPNVIQWVMKNAYLRLNLLALNLINPF